MTYIGNACSFGGSKTIRPDQIEGRIESRVELEGQ